MKKKYLVIILIVVFGFGICVDKLLFTNNDIDDGLSDIGQVKHEHMLSMMLETDSGSGEYTLETRSSWPTKEDGYVFNSELSKCEKGSKLSWDGENNLVLMQGTTSDKCYVYFDLIQPSLISDICNNGNNLAGCIKTLYQKSNPDITSIYYHDYTLVNGAGDNSYRYAGASYKVNNFVCFGNDEATCSDDNLYRIIGVFGDQVKLIKWDYATSLLLGTDGDYASVCSSAAYCKNGTSKGTNTQLSIGAYYWNYSTGKNIWSTSKLNTVNLNTNFLNNIGTEWANKIATTTWKVGGNTHSNIRDVQASVAYTNEYVNPAETTTETEKIGLMYTSDYGFAASPSAWTTTLYNYDGNDASGNKITDENWLYMGITEWTILRQSNSYYVAFIIDESGLIGSCSVDDEDGFGMMLAVRPVFYLNSDVTYVSGDGTKDNPIYLVERTTAGLPDAD